MNNVRNIFIQLFNNVFKAKKQEDENTTYDAVADIVDLKEIALNEDKYQEQGLKAIKNGEGEK